MDTLLFQNDYACGKDGRPVTITGIRALIQRLLIRLSVRRGSFLCDPQLGSELHRLPAADGRERDRLALHYAQQALLPEPVRVESASCRTADDRLFVSVTISAEDGTRYPLEVSA